MTCALFGDEYCLNLRSKKGKEMTMNINVGNLFYGIKENCLKNNFINLNYNYSSNPALVQHCLRIRKCSPHGYDHFNAAL